MFAALLVTCLPSFLYDRSGYNVLACGSLPLYERVLFFVLDPCDTKTMRVSELPHVNKDEFRVSLDC